MPPAADGMQVSPCPQSVDVAQAWPRRVVSVVVPPSVTTDPSVTPASVVRATPFLRQMSSMQMRPLAQSLVRVHDSPCWLGVAVELLLQPADAQSVAATPNPRDGSRDIHGGLPVAIRVVCDCAGMGSAPRTPRRSERGYRETRCGSEFFAVGPAGPIACSATSRRRRDLVLSRPGGCRSGRSCRDSGGLSGRTPA